MLKRIFGGSKVVRHTQKDSPIEPGPDSEVSPLLKPYVEETFGEIQTVLHEIASDGIHVDIYVIPSKETACYYTLITSGMSQRPMKPPKGRERFDRAELVMCLPPDWPLGESELSKEEYYWPIRCLKTLARFPHQYHTWLNMGHTIPNGNPPHPYAPNTELCCALLSPVMFRRPMPRLTFEEGNWIDFLHVVLIYEAEMKHTLKYGSERLLGKMLEEGSLSVLDPMRPDYCKRKPG